MTRKKAGTRPAFETYGTTFREIVRWKLIVYARRTNKGSVAIETEMNKILGDENLDLENLGQLCVNERKIRQFWSFPAKQAEPPAIKNSPYDPTDKEIELLNQYLNVVLAEYASITNIVDLAREYGDTATRFLYGCIPDEDQCKKQLMHADNLQIRTFLSVLEDGCFILLNYRKIPGTSYLLIYLLSTNRMHSLLNLPEESEVEKYDISNINSDLSVIIDRFDVDNCIRTKYSGLLIPNLHANRAAPKISTDAHGFSSMGYDKDSEGIEYFGKLRSLNNEYLDIALVSGNYAHGHFRMNESKEKTPFSSVAIKFRAHGTNHYDFYPANPYFTYDNRNRRYGGKFDFTFFFEASDRRALEFFDNHFVYVSL